MAKAAVIEHDPAEHAQYMEDLYAGAPASRLMDFLESGPFAKMMEEPQFRTKVAELNSLVYDISRHFREYRPEVAKELIKTRIPEMLARLDEDLLIDDSKLTERLLTGKWYPYSKGSWSQDLLTNICSHYHMWYEEKTSSIYVQGIEGLLLDPELQPLADSAVFKEAVRRLAHMGINTADDDIKHDSGYVAEEVKRSTSAWQIINDLAVERNVPKEALDRLRHNIANYGKEASPENMGAIGAFVR